jgi:hypothetical protein
VSQLQAKNWIDLGEWGKGMDGFKLPPSNDLVGKEFVFYFNAGDDQVVRYLFHDSKSLTWIVLKDPEKGQAHTVKYEAVRIASNIYFIDFVKNDLPNVSVSIALDLNTRKAMVFAAVAPDRKRASQGFVERLERGVDLSTVKVEILHADINHSSPEKPVAPLDRTLDLVGKRIKYTYSRNHVYEHIYLNDRLFTWHCLVGLEKGLADTEICDYFKIAPDVYLFTWREKVMPTFGLVLINLKEMRSNGKTFGLDISSGKYVNFTMGAFAEFINETRYPENK